MKAKLNTFKSGKGDCISLRLKNGEAVEFDLMSETLFTWSKNCIIEKN